MTSCIAKCEDMSNPHPHVQLRKPGPREVSTCILLGTPESTWNIPEPYRPHPHASCSNQDLIQSYRRHKGVSQGTEGWSAH